MVSADDLIFGPDWALKGESGWVVRYLAATGNFIAVHQSSDRYIELGYVPIKLEANTVMRGSGDLEVPRDLLWVRDRITEWNGLSHQERMSRLQLSPTSCAARRHWTGTGFATEERDR